MPALTTTLGTNEIRTGLTPRQMQRVYHGFAGVNGLTVMAMGSRGYAVPIVGRLRVQAATYALRRTELRAAIAALENTQALAADTYTYGGDSYANAIFEHLRLLPGPDGRTFVDLPRVGQMTCEFTITLRGLL